MGPSSLSEFTTSELEEATSSTEPFDSTRDPSPGPPRLLPESAESSTLSTTLRTTTLVKGAIVTVDCAPFRQWYESHYATPLARKKNSKLSTEEEAAIDISKRSKSTQVEYTERQKSAEVAANLVEQFGQGRLLARVSSRPGQCGRCDGYILEGKELEFYVRKLKAKKTK